ncbi:hypothetical protein [Spirosoma gilvum]
MAEVPTYEEFKVQVKRVEQLEADIEFLKSLLTDIRWLSRNQAVIALNIKDDKLRRLTVDGVLTHRYEGAKPFYDVFSIREYLADRKIDKRLLTANYT